MKPFDKFILGIYIFLSGFFSSEYLNRSHIRDIGKEKARIEEIVSVDTTCSGIDTNRTLKLFYPFQPDEEFEWGEYIFEETEKGKFVPCGKENVFVGERFGGNYKKPF